MKQYVNLITTILQEGRVKTDRTGTGTISIFGHQETFYMKDGFPLLTMKKTYPRGVFEELFWFLRGDTNIRYLNQRNVHIWDEWAYAKYKKYAESLEEADYDVHVDDPGHNCTRILTQEEFCKAVVDDEEFAKKWGDLGPIYGKQWVNWGTKPHKYLVDAGDDEKKVEYNEQVTFNQIQNVIDRLKNVPDCRRLIVSAWNVAELSEMALTPCHALFQFITEPLTYQERLDIACKKDDNGCIPVVPMYPKEEQMIEFMDGKKIPKFRLSLQLYQRSQDHFLGAPFNIASYALLLHMMAQVVNMIPYKFVHTSGDVHLYLNHKEQVNEFLHRTHNNNKKEKIDYWNKIMQGELPSELLGTYFGTPLPKIKLNSKIKNIFDFTIDDVELIDYNPLPSIKAPVAV